MARCHSFFLMAEKFCVCVCVLFFNMLPLIEYMLQEAKDFVCYSYQWVLNVWYILDTRGKHNIYTPFEWMNVEEFSPTFERSMFWSFPSGIIILLFNLHNVSQWRGAILVYFQDLYTLNTWGIYTRIIFKSLNGTFEKFIKKWWNINIQIASCDKKLHQRLAYYIYITESRFLSVNYNKVSTHFL